MQVRFHVFKIKMNKLIKVSLSVIIGILLIIFINKGIILFQNQSCYDRCSEWHIMGEALHWNYVDYIIDQADTIWVDRECYNDWCICIDECNPGLCCDLLK